MLQFPWPVLYGKGVISALLAVTVQTKTLLSAMFWKSTQNILLANVAMQNHIKLFQHYSVLLLN